MNIIIAKVLHKKVSREKETVRYVTPKKLKIGIIIKTAAKLGKQVLWGLEIIVVNSMKKVNKRSPFASSETEIYA